MTGRACQRPGCGEPVLSWLHPHYCSRRCQYLVHGEPPPLAPPEPPSAPPAPPPAPVPATRPGWLAHAIRRLLGSTP